MKIVHIVPALTRGGAERVVVHLANHAVRRGHEVTVVCLANARDGIANELDPGVSVHYIADESGRLGRYVSVLRWLRREWAWIAGKDVVHCHMTAAAVLGAMAFMFKRAKGLSRPAVVETYHAVGMPIPRAHRWFHARLAARRDSLILMAEDPYWRRFMENHPKLISGVIPNGIALPLDISPSSAEARHRARIAPGIAGQAKLVVGTIGRLAPARRPAVYPEIFRIIAAQLGGEVQFVIGGDGPERSRLEQAIDKAGLAGRVQLLGLVREPFHVYPALDLYITLNVGAVTGVAALEAAAMGVPVLAMQLLEAYKTSAADWIWSSPDVDAVGRKAAELLRNEESLNKLALQQKAHVRAHHSAEAMGNAYDGYYSAALQSAGRPATAASSQ